MNNSNFKEYDKARQAFSSKLDELKYKRSKCRCCGQDIYYPGTQISGKRVLKIKGPSAESIKNINGHTYNLEVCYKCLCKHFGKIYPAEIKKGSGNGFSLFSTINEEVRFAYGISDKDYAAAKDKQSKRNLGRRSSNSGEFSQEEFNKKKTEYTHTLDAAGVERPKCRCCGGDIVYPNSAVKVGPRAVSYTGTTCKTEKTVNEHTYTLGVCRDCFVRQFPEYVNKVRPPFNVMCEGTKWAFGVSDEDYRSVCDSYAMTEECMIRKYGEKEGRNRWKKYCAQQSLTNTFEYKHKKYGMTRREFKEYNKSRAVTLENLIDRYGKEEAERRWQQYLDRQKLTKSWDYMVETYGEEQAREINRKKVVCEAIFISKYGEEEGRKKWEKYVNRLNGGVSKVSQEVFNELDKFFADYKTFYASKNEEVVIAGKIKHYRLDYYIPELKVAVEFNGDAFHGNPLIYPDNCCCHPLNPKITAKELQLADNSRYTELKELHDITTYVIWEHDWKRKRVNLSEFAKKIRLNNSEENTVV